MRQLTNLRAHLDQLFLHFSNFCLGFRIGWKFKRRRTQLGE